MPHRGENKKTLSWKTLLLWFLLVRNGRKEGVHILEAAHCGTSECAVFLSAHHKPATSVLLWPDSVSKDLCSLSCIPAQRQGAGCTWDRFSLGTYTLALSLRKALEPLPFTGFICRCLFSVFVMRGRAGK